MNPRRIFAPLALAIFSLPLAGQTVNLTLQNVTPTNPITWNYAPDSLSANTYVGLLRFTDSASANIDTFCIDLAQHVATGGTYTFDITPVANSPITISSGTPMGAVKADRLSLLYGEVFGSNLSNYTPLTTLDSAAKLQGFQLAIWNIVFDSTIDWSVTSGTGDFYVSSADSGSLAAIAQANTYLSLVQADILGNTGTRMGLTALTDSAAQPSIQDQLIPIGLAQIPEPSTYALIVGCLVLGCTIVRRRKLAV